MLDERIYVDLNHFQYIIFDIHTHTHTRSIIHHYVLYMNVYKIFLSRHLSLQFISISLAHTHSFIRFADKILEQFLRQSHFYTFSENENNTKKIRRVKEKNKIFSHTLSLILIEKISIIVGFIKICFTL